MEENKDLVIGRVEPASPDPESLIAMAITEKLPVETMERLLAMRTQLKQEKARESFFDALAKFQSKCPVIPKTKIARNKDGSVRYRYAPLEDIIERVGPILKRHGFSYTLEPIKEENMIGTVCTLHHREGHSENARFVVPIDDNPYMTMSQRYASTLTFTSKYSFCAVTGILTGDDEADVDTAPVYTAGQVQKDEVRQQSNVHNHLAENIKALLLDKRLTTEEVTAGHAWLSKGGHNSTELQTCYNNLAKLLTERQTRETETALNDDNIERTLPGTEGEGNEDTGV